jgi:hypothetical protein
MLSNKRHLGLRARAKTHCTLFRPNLRCHYAHSWARLPQVTTFVTFEDYLPC